jgi:hypothetical protein
MGACLVSECVVLMKMCESFGYEPFVLTGMSMGGHVVEPDFYYKTFIDQFILQAFLFDFRKKMACLAATVWPGPVGLVPFLSWTTASSVFTRVTYTKFASRIMYGKKILYQKLLKGVLSEAIPWQLLERQFYSTKGYTELKVWGFKTQRVLLFSP